jgi:hypothetical protein
LASWGFLTNHARVLLCIARDPAGRCSSGRVTVDGYRVTGIAAIRRISISPAVIGRHR